MLPLAGVRLQCLQPSSLLQVYEIRLGEGRGGVDNPVGADQIPLKHSSVHGSASLCRPACPARVFP